MLDALFQRPHHLRRFRANPLGPTLDQLAGYLTRRGHATCVIHQFLRAAEHYGYWLGTRYPAVTQGHVTKASARQFVHDHLGACACPPRFPRSLIPSRAAVNHLLRLLDQQHPARLLSPPARHDALLAEYDGFLHQTCGLSENTRIYRRRNARQFLDRHFGENAPSPDQLKASDLQDYFRRHAGSLRPGSVAVLASSLRSFLRYLALAHGFDPSLAGAVPAAPQWPMDRLPKSLPDGDLQAVLAYFDVHTATGRRDLAMMRCMCDLGLRVGEVAAMTLDDINWHLGIATIRGGKGGRPRELPLPAPLGRAIAAYLQDGRPSSTARHLFLRHTLPAGTPLTHDLIRGAFRRAYAAATGRTESVGTHVLRHTAAARMRAAGQSLKGIADVLGHRSVDTTTIYVKLDVESLRAVALPWPGGGS